jgi:hypothetical protein
MARAMPEPHRTLSSAHDDRASSQCHAGDHPLRIVTSLDDLLRLPNDHHVNGFGTRMAVRLEIPTLTRHALIRAQRPLNRLQSRCGCAAGSIAMLASMAIGTAQVYSQGAGAFSWRMAAQFAAVLLVAFFVGFVVKMTTLAATRWQFARECRAQYRALMCQQGNTDPSEC